MILRILVNRKYRLPRDKTSLSANATGVFFFFFFLILYVPVNSFQLYCDGYFWGEPVLSKD